MRPGDLAVRQRLMMCASWTSSSGSRLMAMRGIVIRREGQMGGDGPTRDDHGPLPTHRLCITSSIYVTVKHVTYARPLPSCYSTAGPLPLSARRVNTAYCICTVVENNFAEGPHPANYGPQPELQ